jgi:hypothetical protein
MAKEARLRIRQAREMQLQMFHKNPYAEPGG